MESTGQISLAYLAATTHGIEQTAERLLEVLKTSNTPVPKLLQRASLLQPPTPIFRCENWPLLAVGQSVISSVVDSSKVGGVGISNNTEDDEHFHNTSSGWGDDLDVDMGDDEDDTNHKLSSSVKVNAVGGWDEDEIEMSDDEETNQNSTVSGCNDGLRLPDGTYYSLPNAGISPTFSWCNESAHCADHFAAGSVESALKLLNSQIAAVEVSNLKLASLSLFVGSSVFVPGFPLVPPNRSFLFRDVIGKNVVGKPLPSLTLKVSVLLDLLKVAYRSFTNAQFSECKEFLESIIRTIPLVSALSRSEVNDLKELLDVCREYITSIRVKTAVIVGGDITRGLELAAYFTHCSLQPSHLLLALKTAMASAFKNKVPFFSCFALHINIFMF